MKENEKNEMMQSDLSKMNDYELLQFIKQIEQEQMLQAPSYLKEEIIKKSNSPALLLSIQTKKVSKRVQLLWYSLKVSAGVAGALAIIVLCSLPSELIAPPQKEEKAAIEWNVTEKLYEKSNYITNILNDVTSNLLNKK